MVRKTTCPICALNTEARQSFESKVSLGLPATALVDYLITLGVHVTPQQIYSHKKHSKPLQRTTISQSRPVDPRLTTNVSADGLTIDDRQERLLSIALEAVDSLAAQFNADNNLRVARMLKEMGELARALVRDRMDREALPEPNISVSINLGSLEEQLGLPERDMTGQDIKYQREE
ncbi:hypothetical protein GNF10_12175 [Nostoc sp. UCD121]|uniref:hypothetical protein n=1 Tax=unclassified Nostoc TaxID=2593658 RepID=UPI001629A11C|nr:MULTISPECIES: hypothetical protein [unclassified Nostoc]MBC1224158.1 hypothetical protein [Nostoc sp. UCD120]MBC1276720.1 hypothetical protein [Nostoc sp. UCD121]MBC1296568.1 hypothetical protein [Nostoc sp. UCD122]